MPHHDKNWGGKREGSGGVKQTKEYSDAIKADFMAAAEKMAIKKKKTVGEVVLGMAYDPNVQDSVRLAAVKLYADVVVVRESHKTVEKVESGVVALPPEPAPLEKIEPASLQ